MNPADVEGLNTGMSMESVLSKSMAGTALNLPNDSFIAATRICHIGASFSNLISLFVGCMFTSIVEASTSNFKK